MTDADYTRKLAELDRLLNDPEIPMQPDRIWDMLAALSAYDQTAPSAPQAAPVHAPG